MRFTLKTILLFTLLLFILVFSSCSGECKHRDMSRSIVSASCGNRGYTVFVCNDCSFSFESDFVAPSPHELTSSIIEASCTEGGYVLNECSLCDYSYISEPTEMVEHSIISTIVPPTCYSAGYTLNTCSKCSYTTHTDALAATPHVFSTTKIEPTCTQEGYTAYSCKNCDFKFNAEQVSAKAHSFSSSITSPSCTEQGFTTKTCSVCNTKVITDYTEPKGHSYTSKAVRATMLNDGYTLYECRKCKYSYKSDFEYSYSIFAGAYAESNLPIAYGVDVSTYNGSINWSKLANEGIDFAILRAGSTVSGKDPSFDTNYKSAHAAGIDLGVYYYVEATSVQEILECARDLKNIIEDKKFEYPIYLDFEKITLGQSLGRELVTEMCLAFIEDLQKDGYFAALYTNNNWLENFYVKDTIIKECDIWYARYLPDTEISLPEWKLEKYGPNMGMWQYTQNGTFSGYDTPFDLNVTFKDYPSIIKRYHYNGY